MSFLVDKNVAIDSLKTSNFIQTSQQKVDSQSDAIQALLEFSNTFVNMSQPHGSFNNFEERCCNNNNNNNVILSFKPDDISDMNLAHFSLVNITESQSDSQFLSSETSMATQALTQEQSKTEIQLSSLDDQQLYGEGIYLLTDNYVDTESDSDQCQSEELQDKSKYQEQNNNDKENLENISLNILEEKTCHQNNYQQAIEKFQSPFYIDQKTFKQNQYLNEKNTCSEVICSLSNETPLPSFSTIFQRQLLTSSVECGYSYSSGLPQMEWFMSPKANWTDQQPVLMENNVQTKTNYFQSTPNDGFYSYGNQVQSTEYNSICGLTPGNFELTDSITDSEPENRIQNANLEQDSLTSFNYPQLIELTTISDAPVTMSDDIKHSLTETPCVVVNSTKYNQLPTAPVSFTTTTTNLTLGCKTVTVKVAKLNSGLSISRISNTNVVNDHVVKSNLFQTIETTEQETHNKNVPNVAKTISTGSAAYDSYSHLCSNKSQKNKLVNRECAENYEHFSERRSYSRDFIARNRPLNRVAVEIMENWYLKHIELPYPQLTEKIEMAAKGKVLISQVNSWFANRRNRQGNTRPKKNKKMMQQQLFNYSKSLEARTHGVLTATDVLSDIMNIIHEYLN